MYLNYKFNNSGHGTEEIDTLTNIEKFVREVRTTLKSNTIMNGSSIAVLSVPQDGCCPTDYAIFYRGDKFSYVVDDENLPYKEFKQRLEKTLNL